VRGVTLVVGALAIARAIGAIGRRRAQVARVASPLRSPLLYLPTDLTNMTQLRIARALVVWPSRVVAGVEVSARTASAGPSSRDVVVVTYSRSDRVGPSGAVLWIHGGGLVMGDPKQSHALCSQMADELGIVVVSVDYRLAPEHPFPAGLDDCMTALSWLSAHSGELGVDPARIAVGGESAGGGLAAAVAQAARDRGGPALCFQLLVYPMLDDRATEASTGDGGAPFIWTLASNRFAWRAYLGADVGGGEARPYAMPGRCDDLRRLPPAWIGVGDLDLFFEEDLDYARRLGEAGVACEVHVEPGMYHGADGVVPRAPSMRAFRRRMIDALSATLTTS